MVAQTETLFQVVVKLKPGKGMFLYFSLFRYSRMMKERIC